MKKFRAVFSELSNKKDKEQHEYVFESTTWIEAIAICGSFRVGLETRLGNPLELRLLMREIGT